MPVVEEENVGNTLAEVECKVVLETLAAIETDVKVHTLGDTQVEINAKALDYEMTNKEEEVKLEIFGDTRQRRKKCPCKHTC